MVASATGAYNADGVRAGRVYVFYGGDFIKGYVPADVLAVPAYNRIGLLALFVLLVLFAYLKFIHTNLK